MATGRSDCPNQINNVLVFPGLFRGALDCRARDITCGMKLAAAYGIAGLVSGEELGRSISFLLRLMNVWLRQWLRR